MKNLKTFELFNFYPNKDNIEKKKKSRILHLSVSLDKEYKFIGFEKELLKSFGFIIVEDNIEGYQKFHTKSLNFGNKLNDAKEIATSSIDDYRIIIWKYSPKSIEYAWASYFYYILDKNNKIKLEGYKSFTNNYPEYIEEYINKKRKDTLIDILEDITVELEILGVKIPESPDPHSKIDPYGEENWE